MCDRFNSPLISLKIAITVYPIFNPISLFLNTLQVMGLPKVRKTESNRPYLAMLAQDVPKSEFRILLLFD